MSYWIHRTGVEEGLLSADRHERRYLIRSFTNLIHTSVSLHSGGEGRAVARGGVPDIPAIRATLRLSFSFGMDASLA